MLALLLGLLCTGLTACGSTDTAAKDETPSAPTVEQPEPEPTPEEVRRTAAEQYADGLTLEEQVAQMFFVRCPETDAAALTAQYDIGGYLLFARDFDGQTKESVANTIAAYQMPQNAHAHRRGRGRRHGRARQLQPESARHEIPVTAGRCTARAALTASRATPPRRTRCCAI